MKVSSSMAVAWSLAFVICIFMAKMVYSVYWKPKVLERILKQQGIRGSSYKLIYGDKKVMQDMNRQTWSTPMSSMNHKIVPRVTPFIDLMVHKYGNVCLSWFGTMPRLIVAKAELMKMILNDKSGQFKRPPVSPLVDLLTMGLSTLEGEKWAKRRKLLTPAFHHEKLQGMVPEFLASCSNLIDHWKNILAASSDGWSEIDVCPELKGLSADVISRTAFGSSYEEGKKIFDLQEEQTVLALEAFQGLYFPGLKYIPTKKNRRRYKVDNEIKSILREIIHKKQRAIQNGESSGDDDLLGLLLQCKDQNGSDMTIEDIIEECKLFYFAGQETTAQWLTWALIILAMHPEWQEKARQEVLQIFGNKSLNSDILNQLKIVTMVLYEVLRLYPPISNMFRYTARRTTIGGITIPAGVEIFLPTILLHHSTEYWGDDAQEFKPQRFAEGVSKASKDQLLAFYTFGWGPRICLGQNFAVIEVKLALSMILQNFSFKLSPSYTHAPYTIITLRPQHGAPLIFQPV